MEVPQISPQVDPKLEGKSLWEYADSSRDDLSVMRHCCDVIEKEYWDAPYGGRLSPAPFYFRRVAILGRKAKDYALEIAVCERWIAMAMDYSSQPKYLDGQMALVNLSPEGELVSRLAKARELLAKAA